MPLPSQWPNALKTPQKTGPTPSIRCNRTTHNRQYGRVLDAMADSRHDVTALEESLVLSNVNKVQFGLGLLVVIFAASLLLMDVLESGAAAGLGFIGIVLISASGWNRKGT